MSIGSKSTRLAPTISHTLLLPLQRPLGFRSPVLFVSPSICRRPPCLDATVLARGEDSTVLFAPVNPCLDMDTLVQNTYRTVDMCRADDLLSVCARKPDRLVRITNPVVVLVTQPQRYEI